MSSPPTANDARVAARFDWTITAVWVIAGITAAGYFIGPVFNLINLIGWLQPHASVPVDLSGGYALPKPTGQNHYTGSPYIADGQSVTATQTHAEVTGLNTFTVVMLALTPAAWSLTVAFTAMCVARAAGSLRAGRQPGALVVRMLHRAAAALGIGSTLAQLLQAAANLGLGHIAWNSPALGDAGSFNAGATTFSFLPLIATIGILATATTLNRTLQDPERGLLADV